MAKAGARERIILACEECKRRNYYTKKNKSNTKHASVINIASTAAVVPIAESPLSAPGHGTWSCELITDFCTEILL